jgi:hypothetical protein
VGRRSIALTSAASNSPAAYGLHRRAAQPRANACLRNSAYACALKNDRQPERRDGWLSCEIQAGGHSKIHIDDEANRPGAAHVREKRCCGTVQLRVIPHGTQQTQQRCSYARIVVDDRKVSASYVARVFSELIPAVPSCQRAALIRHARRLPLFVPARNLFCTASSRSAINDSGR